MEYSIEQYATGSGLALGAGIGATVATLSGLDAALALIAGFGVAGGMVVGAVAGRYAEIQHRHDGWFVRVAGFTLAMSLIVGGLLGFLVAWSFDGSLATGLTVGGASGVVFGAILSTIIKQLVEGRDPSLLGETRS